MTDANAPGTTGGGKENRLSDTQRSPSGSRIKNLSQAAVDYLLESIRANNGVAEIPVRGSDGASVGELAAEDYGEPWNGIFERLVEDCDTISFEDFFGADLEENGIEYLGTPPLIQTRDRGDGKDDIESPKGLVEEIDGFEQADLEAYSSDSLYPHGDPSKGLKKYVPHPDWAEDVDNGKFASNLQNKANQSTTARWFGYVDGVVDSPSGERTRLVARKGRRQNNETEEGRLSSVAFMLETTESVPDRVVSAFFHEGKIDQETREKYDSGQLDLAEVLDIAESD